MDERLKFIARLLDGEQMAGVPGVRYLPKTGYKSLPATMRSAWKG
jgi:hypothetical protein